MIKYLINSLSKNNKLRKKFVYLIIMKQNNLFRLKVSYFKTLNIWIKMK